VQQQIAGHWRRDLGGATGGGCCWPALAAQVGMEKEKDSGRRPEGGRRAAARRPHAVGLVA